MATRSSSGSYIEPYMGFRIHMRNGIYIAQPTDWSKGTDEAIVSADLVTIRQEIRRWWFQVDA
jgi:hypothetical protein